MYARKKSCATQQLDAVGFAKFVKFEKWCDVYQGSCASSPAVQVLEWTAHTHQRFTGMVCWSHSVLFATKLSRSQSAWPHHKRYLLFKKIASIVQLFVNTDLVSTHWCCAGSASWNSVFFLIFLWQVHRPQLSVPHHTPPPSTLQYDAGSEGSNATFGYAGRRFFASHEGVFSDDL